MKVSPVANPELGAKQVCPNCQAKFYDLNRRPAHCPKCGTDFDPEEAMKLRSRRARPGYPADDEDTEDQVKTKSADGDDDEDDNETSTPEIDEEGHEPILTPDDDDDSPADASEEPGMGSTDGDDDDLMADDDDDSVPFIEDEDDDSIDDEIAKPSRDDD
nr:TIGR02300 family protein [Brevundimonas sp. EYE_349]